jgi:hypothetical protein
VPHADIALAFLEYQATFRDPIVVLHRFYGAVTEAGFRVFRGAGVSLEHVAHRPNPSNLNEVQTTYSVPGGRIVANVGLGSITVLVKDPAWSEADVLSTLIKGAVEAICTAGEVIVEKQRASLALHLRPAGSTRGSPLRGLMTVRDVPLLQNANGYGLSVYRSDSAIVVDASQLYPGALFVRLDCAGTETTTLGEMSERLLNTEKQVLELLDFQVEGL